MHQTEQSCQELSRTTCKGPRGAAATHQPCGGGLSGRHTALTLLVPTCARGFWVPGLSSLQGRVLWKQ